MNEAEYKSRMAGIQAERDQISKEIEEKYGDFEGGVVRRQGRWVPRPKPQELEHLEKELKRINEVEKGIDAAYKHRQRAASDREIRKSGRGDAVERVRDLRKEAAEHGAGSPQDVEYLKARAEYKERYGKGAVSDYAPVNYQREYRPAEERVSGKAGGVPYDVPAGATVHPEHLGKLGVEPQSEPQMHTRTQTINPMALKEYGQAVGEMHKEALAAKKMGLVPITVPIQHKGQVLKEGIYKREIGGKTSYYTSIENVKVVIEEPEAPESQPNVLQTWEPPSTLFKRIAFEGEKLKQTGERAQRRTTRDPNVIDSLKAIGYQSAGRTLEVIGEAPPALYQGSKNVYSYAKEHPAEVAISVGLVLLPEAVSSTVGVANLGRIGKVAYSTYKVGVGGYFAYHGYRYAGSAVERVQASPYKLRTGFEIVGEIGTSAVAYKVVASTPYVIKAAIPTTAYTFKKMMSSKVGTLKHKPQKRRISKAALRKGQRTDYIKQKYTESGDPAFIDRVAKKDGVTHYIKTLDKKTASPKHGKGRVTFESGEVHSRIKRGRHQLIERVTKGATLGSTMKEPLIKQIGTKQYIKAGPGYAMKGSVSSPFPKQQHVILTRKPVTVDKSVMTSKGKGPGPSVTEKRAPFGKREYRRVDISQQLDEVMGPKKKPSLIVHEQQYKAPPGWRSKTQYDLVMSRMQQQQQTLTEFKTPTVEGLKLSDIHLENPTASRLMLLRKADIKPGALFDTYSRVKYGLDINIKSDQAQDAKPAIRSATLSETTIANDIDVATVQAQDVKSLTGPRLRGRSKVAQDIASVPVMEPAPIIVDEPITPPDEDRTRRPRPPRKYDYDYPEFFPEIGTPGGGAEIFGFSPRERMKGLFSVMVRRRGTFYTEGTAPTVGRAFDIGIEKVTHSAAASFKILGDRQAVQKGAASFLSDRFRRSKVDPDIFVEKRQFRISTPGEKREITFKGIAASKGKKKGLFDEIKL